LAGAISSPWPCQWLTGSKLRMCAPRLREMQPFRRLTTKSGKKHHARSTLPAPTMTPTSRSRHIYAA